MKSRIQGKTADENMLPGAVVEGKPFDGERLNVLGYSGFKPGVTYALYEILPNTGSVRPVIVFPHEDGTFESSHYTCSFVDRNLNFLPLETYYHPDTFPTQWVTTALIKKARSVACKR